MHVIHCPCHTLFLDIRSYVYRSSHFPPPHYLLPYLFLSHHLSFALISSHPSALLVAFYFSYSPYFFSSPGILPVPSPYHLLSSGLVPSPRRLSENLISPQAMFCLIDATFTARNQKHQNLNLETAFFVFACIHLLSTSCTFVRSNNFNLHFISSPLTSASLIFSHLVSFLLRQMLPSLVSSNVSSSSFLSLVTSCSFPLSLLVPSFLDLLPPFLIFRFSPITFLITYRLISSLFKLSRLCVRFFV